MNSAPYAIPQNLPSALFEPLMSTCEALARLDERVQNSRVLDGWRNRLLYHEACACQLAEGDLIHLTDLVLLDAGAATCHGSIPLANALHTLQTWRQALAADNPAAFLKSCPPAELSAERAAVGIRASTAQDEAGEMIDMERLWHWQDVLEQTAPMHPLIAAAIAWDAWLAIAPEQHGAWRAPLIAAVILKARGLTRNFLAPIDLGRRNHAFRRHEHQTELVRLEGFLHWVAAGLAHAQKQHVRLASIEAQLRRAVDKRQKNSRLPALIDLLVSSPAVSVPMAARKIGISTQAVRVMLNDLSGIPRLLTERKRYSVWAVG